MMFFRDWLTAAVLISLGAVCALSIRDAVTRPTRLVDQFDHDQLRYWLSMHDLSGELTHIKLRLARRLAEDFRQGSDWRHDLAQLDEAGRDRLSANFRELIRIWLLDRADRYAALGEPDRTAFIDEQLDDLVYWPVWQSRSGRELAGLLPRNLTLAAQQIDAWTDGFEMAQRQRIQQFTDALYLRWLQRGVQFLPSGV